MKIEVLVSTMNQNTLEIAEKMNIQTDAIIINQTNRLSHECIVDNDRKIQMFSFNEKGIGLSRNSALMRSRADICLMADDDMIYYEGYEDIIYKAFLNNPSADIILFDVEIENSNGEIKKKVKSNGRIYYHNYMKFGTVNIAFRRERIIEKNIYFSLLFGGGAKYGSGEDTLFLTECLNKGLKVYSNDNVIAKIWYRPSSWFKGYNKKFFNDKGALFYSISPKLCYFLVIQFIFRRKEITRNIGRGKAIKYLLEGINKFKTR